MEKPTINFSFTKLASRFRSGVSVEMSADKLWRILLWGVFLGMVSIFIFAYNTYDWAISVDLPTTTTVRTDRNVLSLTDLTNVINIYRQKEANFTALLGAAPIPPDYHAGVGPIASGTPVSVDEAVQEDTSNFVPSPIQ